MRDDYFLVLLIFILRVADGITSFIPAKGLIQGIGEANPFTLVAIEKWGFFWAFALMTAVSLGFVLAFMAATHLEEARRMNRIDPRGIVNIRRFRIGGLVCLAFLSSFPLINNLALALRLL